MIIAYSIGYSGMGNSGIMTFPLIITAKVFREFSDNIRQPEYINYLFQFAEEQHLTRSSMAIYVNINNERNRMIKMINVREYKEAYDKWIEERRAKQNTNS